jgi:hypothetical protein
VRLGSVNLNTLTEVISELLEIFVSNLITYSSVCKISHPAAVSDDTLAEPFLVGDVKVKR